MSIETTMQDRSFQDDRFWKDLLAFIDEGNVIPVVGSGLLRVRRDGKDVPFYRVVAEELLREQNIPIPQPEDAARFQARQDRVCNSLRYGQELNDAVCLIHQHTREDFVYLYRPIRDILEDQANRYCDQLLAPLINLVSIEKFKLFVATTWDDLLATAIRRVHYDDNPLPNEFEVFSYSLTDSSEKRQELPAERPDNFRAVFHLFGKVSASGGYAVHEEDALEFIYNLLIGKGNIPLGMVHEIRRKHILFIGCPLSDWLGKFLVRLSNINRLSEKRPKREFLVLDEEIMDDHLTAFLKRFSPNSRLFFSPPSIFVRDLLNRWRKRHPAGLSPAGQTQTMRPPAELKGAIFISYASDDFEAAERLYQELKKLAGDEDIAWLDKRGGLTVGDEWKKIIQSRIFKDCKMILPLISKNTEARDRQGTFWDEWCWAEKRDEYEEGCVFPLLIDDDVVNKQPKELKIPESFGNKTLGKAIGGRLDHEVRAKLQEQIRKMRKGN